jgi:hypothetical protein
VELKTEAKHRLCLPRGLELAERETYANGVRKIAYRDADGNEIGSAALHVNNLPGN